MERRVELGPFDYPDCCKQIALVSDRDELFHALFHLAEREMSQVRLCRPETPDIIVFSATVRVVDRELLGRDSWNLFCTFIDEMNDPDVEYPIVDEHGEVVLEYPIYDETPLVIIDHLGDEYPLPRHLRVKVHFIQREATDLIVQLVHNLLRVASDDFVVAPVRAEHGPPGEGVALVDGADEDSDGIG